MEIIFTCWTCEKEYKTTDIELLERAKAKGIKCPECGGYIISPSGKVKCQIK